MDMEHFKLIDDWNTNRSYTLDELDSLVKSLKEKYGGSSEILLDAGANNICVQIKENKSSH